MSDTFIQHGKGKKTLKDWVDVLFHGVMWSRIFFYLGLLLGAVFIVMYINRWLAGTSFLLPVSIYDSAILLGVEKLEHGIPLYASHVSSPTDYFTGPFPTVIVYIIRLIFPEVSVPLVTHKFVLFSALLYSLSIGVLFGWYPWSEDGKIVKLNLSRFFLGMFLALVVMPKERFLYYHSEQLCIAIATVCLVLVLLRTVKPSRLLDFLLGCLAACAFLTKASYLSLFGFLFLIYIVYVPRGLRHFLLVTGGFMFVVVLVVLPWSNLTGWYRYTILYPAGASYQWSILLTGLYAKPFLALISMMVIGVLVSNPLANKNQQKLLLFFGILVSSGIVANMLYPGGTAEHGARHALFLWVPAMIPAVYGLFKTFGYGLIVPIVCFGIQTAEPSATQMRQNAANASVVASKIVEKYPDAVYLTFSNWKAALRGTPPEYDFNCATNLEMIGQLDAGSLILGDVLRRTEFVIVDRFYYDAQEAQHRRSIPFGKVTTLDSLTLVLKNSFTLTEKIQGQYQISERAGSFWVSGSYAEVYKRKR